MKNSILDAIPIKMESMNVSGSGNQELEVNLAALLKAIWYRKVFLAVALALAVGVGWIWYLKAQKIYESSIAFVQSKGDVDLSQMAGLGAVSMLGLGQPASEPPLLKYLEKYIKTREFLFSIRDSTYHDTLVFRKILGKAADQSGAQRAYLGRIAGLLKVVRENGMITIKVRYPDSLFSCYLANVVYNAFAEDFSRERTNLLKENLDFSRELVDRSREEFEKASNALRIFMEQNRATGAPLVEQKRNEIMLRVKMAEEKYIQAEKEKALLEIKNQRKDESLVILEKPFVPDSPVFPKLAICLAAPVGLAILLICFLIAVVDRRRWITTLP